MSDGRKVTKEGGLSTLYNVFFPSFDDESQMEAKTKGKTPVGFPLHLHLKNEWRRICMRVDIKQPPSAASEIDEIRSSEGRGSNGRVESSGRTHSDQAAVEGVKLNSQIKLNISLSAAVCECLPLPTRC